MGCFNIELNRLGNTPTPTLERVGATPTAELDYLGGVPIASLIGLSDVPTATLEHRGGVSIDGSLICHVGNDTLSISAEALTFGSTDVGVSKNILVAASTEWSAEVVGDSSYLFDITTTGTIGGKGAITVTMLAQNTSSSDAVAMLRVKCRGIIKYVVLTAEAGAESYTRLTYIEATGAQYINTGYVVQEDDVIEMQYTKTEQTSADEVLFGCYDNVGSIWFDIYSNTAYVRYGSSETTTVSNARMNNRVKIQRGEVSVDGNEVSLPLNNMPEVPLFLFARNGNGTIVNMYGQYKSTGFKITKTDGSIVMNLKPYKRDSDGKVGMLDLVSGRFFTNQGVGEDFSYGGEAHIQEGYELIEYVTFNNDKIFDTGHYGNENTYIEILFERTDTSGADYLFGTSNGSRMTGYLTSSGYWRYGSGYPTFNTNNKNLNYAYVTPGKTTVSGTTRTFSVGSAFNTQWTIPVGGHKPSSGVAIPTYQGYIYYFRMRIGDEYVADFLPCKRISDNVEGFWDCVTQTFIAPRE